MRDLGPDPGGGRALLDRTAAGVLAAITAGASLGFLRHGFPPASTFMGDTGSNLLGYLLGAVAVQGALKTNAVVALFLPLIVLAVPILDTGFVVAKRLKYRRPFYKADRSHFHHRMANIGFSQRRTLLYLYGWTVVMAALALALRFVPYSDDHGNFDPGWTAVMAVCGALALAASVYLVSVLEILKLRQVDAGGEGEDAANRHHRRPTGVEVAMVVAVGNEAQSERKPRHHHGPAIEVEQRSPLGKADVRHPVVKVGAVGFVQGTAVFQALGDHEAGCRE